MQPQEACEFVIRSMSQRCKETSAEMFEVALIALDTQVSVSAEHPKTETDVGDYDHNIDW